MAQSTIHSYVQKLYQNVLLRSADDADVSYWAGQNLTSTAMVEAFIGSTEVQNITAVLRLYDIFFDRAADSAGLAYWVDKVRNGVSMHDIATSFSDSSEFQAKYAAASSEQYVEALYSNLFERASDAADKAYWVEQLDSGKVSRSEMALAFTSSHEAKAPEGAATRFAESYLALRSAGVTDPSTEETEALAKKSLTDAIIKAAEIGQIADGAIINGTAPTTHFFPFVPTDGTDDGSYDTGDSFWIAFSEPVKVDVLGPDAGNITVSNGHSLGSGATLTTEDTSPISTWLFRVTLGTNPTMVAGDTLTIAAAKIEDEAGNMAAGDVVFTVPTLIADAIAPTIFTLSPPWVPEVANTPWTVWIPTDNDDGPYNAGEKIHISFNEMVEVASLAADASGIAVSNGHSLGSGAVLTADWVFHPYAWSVDGYAYNFTITLGTNPTIVAGDKLAVERTGGFSYKGDGSYDAGDKIHIRFSEPVKAASLAADASGITVSNDHSLGSGATLTHEGGESGYVGGFTITLGANPTVVAGDKLTIAAANVEDEAGNMAAGDVVFTVPTLIADAIAPTASAYEPIEPIVNNYNGSFDAGEMIRILFSEPVKVASLAADASGIAVSNGHSLGSGATLRPRYSDDGFASEYWITLGTNPTVVGADTLTFAADKVEDEMGNMAAGDVVLAVPALIFDVAAPTVWAKEENAMSGTGATNSAANAVVFLVNSSVTVNTLNDILNAGDANFNSFNTSPSYGETTFSYLWDATGLADGTYKVYASDLGGNLSDASSDSVTINRTAPANRGNGLLIQNDSGNSTADAGDALVFEFTEAIYNNRNIEAFFTAGDSYGGSGTRASVAWSAGNTTLTVILGAGESYNAGSPITLTGVMDIANNSADVIFNFT